MNKIINYTLMAMILNFNVALADCEWQLVEETPTYVREQCKAGTGMGARIRNKDINGEVGEFKVVGKEASPLKKFKDKVEQAPKVAEKVEKIKEIEQEVIVTEKKVKELKEEKNVAEKVQDKVEKAVEEAQLHNTPVEETQKSIIKEEIAKKEVDAKSDEKLVKQAEDKTWADIDTEQKVGWMQLRELLPRLIVENEKIIAAEQDYEAAKETWDSEINHSHTDDMGRRQDHIHDRQSQAHHTAGILQTGTCERGRCVRGNQRMVESTESTQYTRSKQESGSQCKSNIGNDNRKSQKR